MNAQMLTQDDPHAGSTHDSPVILIADSFNEAGVDAIRSLGCNVHCDASLDGESLTEAVNQHQPNAIIVRSTKVPQPVFEVADHLSLVIRAGAGYDTIDVAAASSLGISVANCPGMNAIAVAELAWGLILSCDRRIPDQTADLRAGTWAKKEYAKAAGIYGRNARRHWTWSNWSGGCQARPRIWHECHWLEPEPHRDSSERIWALATAKTFSISFECPMSSLSMSPQSLRPSTLLVLNSARR